MRKKYQCEFQDLCPFEGSKGCDLEDPENCDFYYAMMEEMMD